MTPAAAEHLHAVTMAATFYACCLEFMSDACCPAEVARQCCVVLVLTFAGILPVVPTFFTRVSRCHCQQQLQLVIYVRH